MFSPTIHGTVEIVKGVWRGFIQGARDLEQITDASPRSDGFPSDTLPEPVLSVPFQKWSTHTRTLIERDENSDMCPVATRSGAKSPVSLLLQRLIKGWADMATTWKPNHHPQTLLSGHKKPLFH